MDNINVGGTGILFIVLGNKYNEFFFNKYIAPFPKLTITIPNAKNLRPT